MTRIPFNLENVCLKSTDLPISRFKIQGTEAQCPMFLSISYNVPFLWEKTRTFLKALTKESCTFCGGPDQRLMQRKRAMGKTEQDMSRLAHLGSQSQDIICFSLPLAQPVINDIAK